MMEILSESTINGNGHPSHPTTTQGNTLAAAIAAIEAGISFIPVKADGSKSPAIDTWKEWQERRL